MLYACVALFVSALPLRAQDGEVAPPATVDVAQVTVTTSRYLEGAYNVRWALGGTKVLFSRPNNGVHLADAVEEQPAERAVSLGQDTWFEALSPDGRTAYLSSPSEGTVAADLATGERRVLSPTAFRFRAGAANGSRYLLGALSYDGEKQRWTTTGNHVLDARTGRVVPLRSAETAYQFAWSDDGSWLFAAQRDENGVEFHLAIGADSVVALPAGLTHVRWAPDSHDLVAFRTSGGPAGESIAPVRILVDTQQVVPLAPDGPVQAWPRNAELDWRRSISPGLGWVTRMPDWQQTILTHLSTGQEWSVPGEVVHWLSDEAGIVLSDGTVRHLADPGQVAASLSAPWPGRFAYSPDGAWLVCLVGGTIAPVEGTPQVRLDGAALWLLSADGRQARELTKLDPVMRNGLAIGWTPSGSAVVIDERNRSLRFLWLG